MCGWCIRYLTPHDNARILLSRLSLGPRSYLKEGPLGSSSFLNVVFHMRTLTLFLTLAALSSTFTTLSHAQNYALRFGPQTQAVFPYHPSMNTGVTATMEYWVRADSPRGNTTWFRYQDSAEHKVLTVTNNGDIHYLYAGSPWWEGTWYGGVTLPGAGTIAADGQWHHVAFVRRATGGWSIYRDGVRIVNQGPGSGLGNGCWATCNVINATPPTILGNGSTNLPSYDIDDLRISSVERYVDDFVPSRGWIPDAGTVMLLDFNEGSGNQVLDHSGTAQVGTIQGQNPTWEWLLLESSCGSDTLCYCTGKVNSLGCAPSIQASGDTSLTGPDDLHITGTGFLPNTPGLLLWSRTAASTPFMGGTLCLSPQILRTSVQVSGSGGAAPCSGTHDFFFSHSVMNFRGLNPGETVHCQFLARDPALPQDKVSLSNALKFLVKP
jgi:hypothetical protein